MSNTHKNKPPTALRCGTQTGSLMNHVISGCVMASPEIGMGATKICWSDRHACTIVEVSKSGRCVGVVRDIATRIDKNGICDFQSYSYESSSGSPTYYTLRKNGAWVRKGDSMNGSRLAIGWRSEYYDYSF